MKKYQSSSATEPPERADEDILNQRFKNKSNFEKAEEFIDLSNIQDIQDLNQLTTMEKKSREHLNEDGSPVEVDDVEVDLEDDDIEQMERIIRTNMQYAKEGGADRRNDNRFAAETPESGQSGGQDHQAAFFADGGKPEQMQTELQQLLAQSSSEQLLMIDNENNELHLTESEEQELRRKWLQENGLFSAEDSQVPSQPVSAEKDVEQNKSIELGEEPVNLDRNRRLDFQDQSRDNANSPPLVTSHHASKAPAHQDNKVGSILTGAEELEKAPQLISMQHNPDLRAPEKPPLSGHLGTDLSEMKAVDAKDKHHHAKPSKDVEKAIDQSNQEGDENDSFHRLYNKEIKVNQDEIPLLLLELTDIAYKFIKKDQFEKAYVLLQKTESVLEVVNLEHSKRDRYFAYITYLNMAMCFQKLGMLEECIIYLKETIQVIEKPSFFKDVSISQRMKQMHMQCQLKLQLCAILSQTQKHTEAMENAKASVRLAHQILRDMYDLCVFYSNKIKFKDDFASLSLLLMDEMDEDQSQSIAAQDKSKQAYGADSQPEERRAKHTKSEINEKMFQKQFIRENSPVRDIPFNILEESISMIERTALKLLPIMKELGNRLAGTNKNKGLQAFHTVAAGAENSIDTRNLSEQKSMLQQHVKSKKQTNDKGLLEDESEDIKDVDLEIKDKQESEKKATTEKKADDQVDMRTILGFLNQNEWILNLNIGNIMQIQPVRMRDFLQFHRNEHQLSRESFLEKLQLLVVSYFCVSTELRFIIQSRSGFMKAETKKEKELEQEYWHVKALDIACAFLPSECPLFNHILLSYQKHHDPTMQPIDEDKEQEDVLQVLRPLKGIENSKYQPIIREVDNVYIDVAEIPLSPLSKCFDHRLMPKKVKTASINVQTEPIEAPEPPLMKSQSISIQGDLKSPEPEAPKQEHKESQDKVYQDSETLTDIFDANNAYLDLTSSKYQENLMEKIVNDPKINDKQQFLSKLITRVQSQEPEKFVVAYKKHNQKHQGLTNNNTQSQNLNNISYFQQQYQTDQQTTINKTLTAGSSIGIEDQGIYGHQGQKRAKTGLMANKSKNTQSGQLNYKQKRQGQNFDDLQYSFDMKSQFGKNHVRSMYGAGDGESDATAIGTGMKHHIASQSLAPSQTVLTDQKPSKKGAAMSKNSHLISHKKNQSISGLLKSEDMFKNTNLKAKQTMEYSSVNRQFNNSVNSNFSSKHQHGGTKKKQTKSNEKKEQAKMAQGNKMFGTKIDKVSSNINLSNQKHQKSQKQQKNQQPNSTLKKTLDKSGRQGKVLAQPKQSKSYQSTHVVHKIPTTKNEDSLMKEIGDVMSSSYSQSENGHCSSPSSGADPDLQHVQLPSQPESSLSEMNKTHTDQSIQSMHNNTQPDENISAIFRSQEERERFLEAKKKYSTNLDPNRQKTDSQNQLHAGAAGDNAQNKKQRPSSSSAITNYTSGQSALRTKLAKQRVTNLQQQLPQNFSRGQMSKQLQQIQQQQKLLKNMKQQKQKQLDSGAPLVPKKKSKVLSRKKYGSDKSSNSPPQNVTQSGGHHGYSIAQAPFSIFDSGNSHSISKFSNLQQSKQSIPDQGPTIYQYQDRSLSKKKKSTHVNSQTIQIENKNTNLQKNTKQKKEINVQNQSENILSRLQNLLVKKEDDRLNHYDNLRKLEKKTKNMNSGQIVNQQPLQMKSQYNSHGQYTGKYTNHSNPRKSANSIGSLGYSHSGQTRQSRYSANSKQSHSRKSRVSRSKSSGKSGRGQKSVSNERSKSKSKSRSKDRSQNNQMNISNQEGFNTSHVSPDVNRSQILHSHNYLESDGDPQFEKNQRSFELQLMAQEAGRTVHQSQDPKKRKTRQNALRQRPKTSMMFENQRESLNARKSRPRMQQPLPKKQPKPQHNHSIENLQRQVLENQKILLSNAGLQQRSQKQSKRNTNFHARHNHNNSISHMNAGTANNQSLFSNQNQAFQTHMSSSGPISGASANTFSKKKSTRKSQGGPKTAGPQQRLQNQQLLNSYQQSQMMNNLQSGLQNIQNKNLSLKMTQQHLSSNPLKHFANIMGGGGAVSTTASTTGAAQQFQSNKSMRPRKLNAHKRKGSTSGQGQLAQREFVNFEQMQQQLEGGVTLGGADIQQTGPDFALFMQDQQEMVDIDQIQDGQNMGFVPHKNLMPKTTGSQAHLLNIQQQQHEAASSVGPGLSGCLAGGPPTTHKSFHSLNQTGRTASSANRNTHSANAQSHPVAGRRAQKPMQV